jgi:hypothetical protein
VYWASTSSQRRIMSSERVQPPVVRENNFFLLDHLDENSSECAHRSMQLNGHYEAFCETMNIPLVNSAIFFYNRAHPKRGGR